MYIIWLLKCPYFDPDSSLRIRLIWPIHPSDKKREGIHNVWACLYGLDDFTVNWLLRKSITRKDIISTQIKKYFRYNNEKESYQLKRERKEEVINYLKIFPFDKELQNRIQKGWENKVQI